MESLPDEINILIASFIDASEWRATKYSSYRLVSRQFARIGAQHMFESFQFRPTEAAIERMNTIATSDLKRYVKVLDFDGELDAADGTLIAVSEDVRAQVFTKVLCGFSQAKSPIDLLNAQHLPSIVFQSGALPQQLTNITTLDLQIDAVTELPDEDESYVRVPKLPDFLVGLHKLEKLSLGFGKESDWSEWSMPPALKEFLPLEHVWPCLRSIQLEHLSITADEIVALLAKYERNLKCFHFMGLRLTDIDTPFHWDDEDNADLKRKKREVAWRRVFVQIEKMEVLRHGEIRTRSESAAKVRKEVCRRMVEIETDVGEWLAEDWIEVEEDLKADDPEEDEDL